MTGQEIRKVPDDFPTEKLEGAVAGLQPILAVRMVSGQFLQEWNEEERYARYDACLDLVTQLEAYCRRKLKDKPDLDSKVFFGNLGQSVLNMDWGLSTAELDWVMGHLGKRTGGELVKPAQPGLTLSPCGATVFELTPDEVARLLALEQRPMIKVESMVDFARRRLAERSRELGYP